jgi:hypothetical protein
VQARSWAGVRVNPILSRYRRREVEMFYVGAKPSVFRCMVPGFDSRGP